MLLPSSENLGESLSLVPYLYKRANTEIASQALSGNSTRVVLTVVPATGRQSTAHCIMVVNNWTVSKYTKNSLVCCLPEMYFLYLFH